MQIYLPIAELPISVLMVLGLSGAVGFISGLFGVGGGFLLTPLLIFLDIPPAVAVATVAAQVAGSSMTGVLTYLRRKALDLKLGGVLVSGGIVGTLLGVLFFNAMKRLGQLELVITLSYVTLFSIIGGLMLYDALRAMLRVRRTSPWRANSAPRWRAKAGCCSVAAAMPASWMRSIKARTQPAGSPSACCRQPIPVICRMR